jgi:hypothetical protein
MHRFLFSLIWIVALKFAFGDAPPGRIAAVSDDTERWVSENLLFMRVWWGRHWGSDYIYNADTCSLIYSEGF